MAKPQDIVKQFGSVIGRLSTGQKLGMVAMVLVVAGGVAAAAV